MSMLLASGEELWARGQCSAADVSAEPILPGVSICKEAGGGGWRKGMEEE